jgi:hypothetical protein
MDRWHNIRGQEPRYLLPPRSVRKPSRTTDLVERNRFIDAFPFFWSFAIGTTQSNGSLVSQLSSRSPGIAAFPSRQVRGNTQLNERACTPSYSLTSTSGSLLEGVDSGLPAVDFRIACPPKARRIIVIATIEIAYWVFVPASRLNHGW